MNHDDVPNNVYPAVVDLHRDLATLFSLLRLRVQRSPHALQHCIAGSWVLDKYASAIGAKNGGCHPNDVDFFSNYKMPRREVREIASMMTKKGIPFQIIEYKDR